MSGSQALVYHISRVSHTFLEPTLCCTEQSLFQEKPFPKQLLHLSTITILLLILLFLQGSCQQGKEYSNCRSHHEACLHLMAYKLQLPHGNVSNVSCTRCHIRTIIPIAVLPTAICLEMGPLNRWLVGRQEEPSAF